MAYRHHNNFDLIRLLAALQVAVLHTFWWLQVPLYEPVDQLLKAVPGVAVFFVISGFLVTRSYVGRSNGLLDYLTGRALRIYPALWLQYLLVMVLMACTGGLALSALGQARFWAWLLAAMFIGSNFWANLIVGDSPFSWDGLYRSYPSDVLWTIPVELGFYLLVPLVFSRTAARLKLTPWLIGLSFCASLLSALTWGGLLRSAPAANLTGVLHSSPVFYFWLFLTGATVSHYWSQLRHFFIDRAQWWTLSWMLATLLSYLLTGSTSVDYRVPTPAVVPRALLLTGVVLSLAHSWPQLSAWMRGHDLSYGLYLLHMPLPLGLYFAGCTGDVRLVYVSLAFALGMAAVSWKWVESPCLDLRARLRTSGREGQSRPFNAQRARPLAIAAAVLALIVVSSVLLVRSSLFDRHGEDALERFFGGVPAVVAGTYQAPNLRLHRGELLVGSETGNAGLLLEVPAVPHGGRILRLAGQPIGAQPVTGRLVVDDESPRYFGMLDGEQTFTVPPGRRIALLIYADLPYRYRIDRLSVTQCVQCADDTPPGVSRSAHAGEP